MAAYSYLIKGGTIIDGSGFPRAEGDVGLAGEIVKDVGSLNTDSAARVIDVSGLYVMPGIIDITNHSDTHWKLFSEPSQSSMLSQGITTILGGLCGSSLAPFSDTYALRSIQKWTDISRVNINWRSQEEFFNELEAHDLGVNFGTLVGHGTLRRDIARDEIRELSRPELESMKLLLRRSLDEGALGLSFGLASSHGRTVSQEEIIELSKIVANSGKLVSIHLRNEGRRLLASVIEAINIARLSGANVQITHLKAIGRKAWRDMPRVLRIVSKVRKSEHLPVWVDFFPYLRTGSLLHNVLPEWILEGGQEAILERLQNKKMRDEVFSAIKDLTLHYENIMIAQARRDSRAVGKTIKQIADSTGLTPEEIMVHLLVNNRLSVIIFGKTLRSRDLVRIAREEYSIFASDGVGDSIVGIEERDGLTHPRSYGAAPRFLSRLCSVNNVLTWEEAVKKMTYLPAQRLGIEKSRGMLKKGYYADLVVFDPKKIKDQATYLDPYQVPTGIEYVFINGNLAIEKGIYTGSLKGKVIRKG